MNTTIMILTCNQLDAVKRCLNSLKHTANRPDVDVLTLDNASTDGTVDYLKTECPIPCFVHYSPDNLGVAAGRAALLEQATGDYLVFLDSDVVITDDRWLARLIAPLRTENIGIVGVAGSYVMADWSGFYPAPPDEQCDVVSGFCQAFKREVLYSGLALRTGDFPHFWGEDSAWCLDICEAGYDVWSVGYGIGVYHVPGLSGDREGLRELAQITLKELFGGHGLIRSEGLY